MRKTAAPVSPPSPSDPKPGGPRAMEFEYMRKLGEGSFGKVYQVKGLEGSLKERMFALKVRSAGDLYGPACPPPSGILTKDSE